MLGGRYTFDMKIQVITYTVSSLERSHNFYTKTLGFTPLDTFKETRWQSYSFEGNATFAIIEDKNMRPRTSSDIINFIVADIENYWNEIKDSDVEVEQKPSKTPWGAYKMVIKDLDGLRLGFVQNAS